MKFKPITTGLIAVASPIPLLIITSMWSLICYFGIGMSLLNYETVPLWIQMCSLLPLLISPTIGVLGIVHGCIKIKEQYAWGGILLSVLGLVENFLLIYVIYYLGSRF
jgi:hypothetical protein